jgi:hypothetical protein
LIFANEDPEIRALSSVLLILGQSSYSSTNLWHFAFRMVKLSIDFGHSRPALGLEAWGSSSVRHSTAEDGERFARLAVAVASHAAGAPTRRLPPPADGIAMDASTRRWRSDLNRTAGWRPEVVFACISAQHRVPAPGRGDRLDLIWPESINP